jgi:signal transduction histidine kinase
MERYPSATAPADEEQSCGWRTLALGIASLLVEIPEQHHSMLSEIARQIKAPVAALRADAERLELEAAGRSDADAARELAGRIVEQADLMADWVNAILEVQRIRVGKLPLDLKPLDLRAVVREASCKVDLQLNETESNPIPIRADHACLRQVLTTVFETFSQHNNTIGVRVHAGETEDGHKQVILTLSDTNRDPGPDATRRRLTSSTELELGLYVAREIVRLHGGDLWTDRQGLGRGGAVSLRFPLHIMDGSHAVVAHGPSCSPAQRSV